MNHANGSGSIYRTPDPPAPFTWGRSPGAKHIPRDEWPDFDAAPAVQPADPQAPLSDLQLEAVAHARSLNNYSFFDAGNVSLTPSTLTSNGMRTDAGVGFSIAVQNKIVMRVYIAFGAGEGSHPNAKMANAF